MLCYPCRLVLCSLQPHVIKVKEKHIDETYCEIEVTGQTVAALIGSILGG
jgi:hypothetical protein